MTLRSVSIILLIFGLGFGSGFLFSGRLTKQRIEAVKAHETPQGFKNDLYKYLKPEDRQKKVIDSIVATFVPLIKEERAISRLVQKHLRDSMLASIQQILDAKQKGDLNRFEKEKMRAPLPKKTKGNRDTLPTTKKEIIKKRMEIYRESLSPEEQIKFDSTINRRPKGNKRADMRAQTRAYILETMLPVLKSYRVKFDKELSADERNTLKDLRQQRDALKLDWLQNQIDDADKSENREAIRAFMETSKRPLQIITLKHRARLEAINSELEPLRQKWIEDLTAIRAKYQPDGKPFQSDRINNPRKNTVEFLLMDPGL